MHRVGLKVRDKKVLKLIGKYLRAGVRLEDGTTEATPRGVPQGGPIVLLLAASGQHHARSSGPAHSTNGLALCTIR